MSHEIRTPLTSMIGFTEVLEDMDLEPPADRFAQLIHRGGDRLLDTLNSVLDLSQLEAGAMTIRPVPLQVCHEVRDIVEGFGPRADESGVVLHLDVPDDPALVETDRGALQRIVTNLVSNAIKFTEEGGRVTVQVDPQPERLVLTVADTGVGIDEAFLPNLFDAFKQESTGDAREFEGSGLGMSITKQLVDMMGGTIAVDSVKGEGTTVTVTIPSGAEATERAPGRADRAEPKGATPKSSTPNGSKSNGSKSNGRISGERRR
jgi:signal transduction histidine kinase